MSSCLLLSTVCWLSSDDGSLAQVQIFVGVTFGQGVISAEEPQQRHLPLQGKEVKKPSWKCSIPRSVQGQDEATWSSEGVPPHGKGGMR